MSNSRFILTTMILCAAPAMLSAQHSDIEILLRGCASIEDDGQRLSCYDGYLRPDHVAESSELPATPVASDKPEAAKPSQSQVEVTEPAVVAKSDKVAEKPEAEQLAVEEFGLKQKQPRDVHVTVTVNGIRKNLNNRFVYTTTDGQVWVQIDRRGVHYDEVPFVAEIRTASLGSFFLRPKENGVSVRVRRDK
jgi:hypothetical protein